MADTVWEHSPPQRQPEGHRLTPLLAIAALGAVAILVAKLFHRFVPEIVVFLALGLLVGPEGPFNLINERNIHSLELVTVVALGLIIFLLGDRLRMAQLKAQSRTLVPLNFAQILATGALVFIATLAVGASARLAFVLAVIAAETGVLTVTATVREERARGEFTETLLTSVGVTNVAVAALFGVSLPFVIATSPEAPGAAAMGTAFLQIVVASTLLGLIGGWILARFSAAMETSGELLLFVLVVITGIAATVMAVNGSVVVATLLAGVFVANRAPWVADRLFAAVRTLESPIYLVFFVVAGAGIHLDELRAVGLMGGAYIVARTAGKIAGSVVGSRFGGNGVTARRAAGIGIGMLPHAGMAIALVAFVVEQAPSIAADVSGVVLGSIVAFELTGPLLLRRVLRATGDSGRSKRNGRKTDAAAILSGGSFERVVIPMGSSAVALPRVGFLLDVIHQLGAELVVVHVSRPGQPGGAPEAEILELVQREAEARGITCATRHCISESVSRAIAETVRDVEADLLIMGEPVRPSMLEARGWGKTTRRVADLIDVPMLVYPVDVAHPGDVSSSTQRGRHRTT